MLKLRSVCKIEQIYSDEQGCTRPIVVKLDDNTTAVLKYPKNQQGEIVLFNEYIASCIAKKIDLTIPNFGLAIINQNTTISKDIKGTLKCFSGIGFYSERIPKTVKASPTILKCVENLHEASKLLLLDSIVKNTDRHSTNILITTDTHPIMYAIDFSHALGDPEWTMQTLSLSDIQSPLIWQENHDFYDMMIRAGAPLSESDLLSAAHVFSGAITNDFLEEIIQQLPCEWNITKCPELLQHAKKYILNRVDNIEHICATIMRERSA